MATIPGRYLPAQGEARFFMTMAVAMALTIVGGFAFQLAMGRSTFAVPLVFHVHAFVFFGWVGFYVLQNALILTGNIALHRRMGWLSIPFVVTMVALGFAMTFVSMRRTGGPFFFDQNEFLVGNPLVLACFAGLVIAAILARADTGWHRRLMYSGMTCLLGPGVGRLLPMPLFIPWAWWVSTLVPLLFIVVGMVADMRMHGRVHRAWFWGAGATLAAFFLGEIVAYTPAGVAATEWVIAGSPGAERPMHAYLP